MKKVFTLTLFFSLMSILVLAQRPTLDDDGRPVSKESKLPGEWDDLGSNGYRVANKVVKPILDGDDIDTTLVTVLKEKDWKEVLLITDWTGSMYDYAPQILRWHLQDRSRLTIKHLVLFNDGDFKPTYEKKVGSTGGIYFVHNPSDENDVLNTIAEAVDNHGNSDGPENDLEAVIRGIQRYDLNKNKSKKPVGFTKVILVADGDSAVRDFELYPQIKYPLHIVLCRGTRSLYQYLEIAYHTKGSIICGPEYLDFSNQPEKVTLEDKNYARKNGKWRRDYSKRI